MDNDFSKLGQKTAEDIAETLIVEVVKKISIEDGDILVIRVGSNDILERFYAALSSFHADKKIMVVDEAQIDLIRDMDEDEMRELGWVKANTPEEIADTRDLLPESED